MFSKAIERDAGFFDYFLGRGLAYARLGRSDLARSDLERSRALLPTAAASHELGKVALATGERDRAKEYFEEAAEAGGDIGAEASKSFVLLDLADNPARYIEAKAYVSKGRLMVSLRNRSPVAVRSVQIRLQRVANKRVTRMTRRVRFIGPGQQQRVGTGWKFDKAADAVRVVVSSATPVP